MGHAEQRSSIKRQSHTFLRLFFFFGARLVATAVCLLIRIGVPRARVKTGTLQCWRSSLRVWLLAGRLLLRQRYRAKKRSHLPWRLQITVAIKIDLLLGKKRTRNAKGPNLACRWGLIVLAGGVKQDQALWEE